MQHMHLGTTNRHSWLSIPLSAKCLGSDAAAAPAISATDMPPVYFALPHPVS